MSASLDTASAVLVRVPATSANLGPGFDALGMALDLMLEVWIRPAQADSAVGMEADPDVPPLSENLAFRAADAVFRAAGQPRPGLRIETRSAIPVSRGLGSSAAAIVAGLVGANALLDCQMDPDDLLAEATRLEGHPDNVAPALLGGMTAAVVTAGGRVGVAQVPVHPELLAGLGLVLVVPEARLATAAARAALPESVSHRDAVFNAARSALLVAVLSGGRLDLLGAALEDRLHEPFRTPLVPGMSRVMALGRDLGAYGVTISGAGPALLAWCPRSARLDIGRELAAAWAGPADAIPVEISHEGAVAETLL